MLLSELMLTACEGDRVQMYIWGGEEITHLKPVDYHLRPANIEVDYKLLEVVDKAYIPASGTSNSVFGVGLLTL